MEGTRIEQFGVIGAGRVAQALAFGLASHSIEPPLMWGRSLEKLGAASAATGSEVAVSLDRLASDCDVIAIAVSDDAIPSIVGDLARKLVADSSTFVFHVSGRSGAAIIDPLRDRGALTAAIHPAMTFTGLPEREVAQMAQARFAVTGSSASATEQARAIVALLGGISIEVAEAQRTLYHAALCHASNHLVTLLTGASHGLARAGVDDPASLLAPLVRAALLNSLDRGFDALSGPLLRGDELTIEGHLAALATDCPEMLPAYRAMALATVDELERTGAGIDLAALRDRLA
ncbi:MAG: DUF2520 domain-containing protein [Sphingopyxis sp.]|nr:DUF2520 domain-containing protein [Sphingopyxis sp.]